MKTVLPFAARLAFIVALAIPTSAAAETTISRCLEGLLSASDPVLASKKGNHVTFEADIGNLGTTAFASLQLRTSVLTEGRSVPWVSDNDSWSLPLPGGIEPGETRTVTFGRVTGDAWMDPLVADLEIVDAIGPDSQSLGASSSICSAAQTAPPWFKYAVQRCWVVDVSSPAAEVSTRLTARVIDGKIKPGEGISRVAATGGDDAAQETAFQAARRALLRCQGSGYDVEDGVYELTFELK